MLNAKVTHSLLTNQRRQSSTIRSTVRQTFQVALHINGLAAVASKLTTFRTSKETAPQVQHQE
jgi:hypothetical protein